MIINTRNIWDKVFKNGPSEICGRQPLNIFTWSILEYLIPSVRGYVVKTFFMQQNILASNLKSLFSLLKRREFVQSEAPNLDKYGAVRSTVVDVSKKDFFRQFTALFPLKTFVSTSCSPPAFFFLSNL